MMHTKFQGNRPNGSRQEDFLSDFLLQVYMVMAAILAMLPRQFEQTDISQSKKRLRMKFGFNLSSGYLSDLG